MRVDAVPRGAKNENTEARRRRATSTAETLLLIVGRIETSMVLNVIFANKNLPRKTVYEYIV